MAPSYKAPGPVAVSRSYAGSGGGGGGGGGSGSYFQAHDQTGEFQNRLQNTGLEGLIQGDLSNQRFVHQSQLQVQAANLDAWQYQQRVTEQEQLQLRQDQNSIAAIDADPTMTPQEKMQAKLRIKTRVDWVGERQKRDLQQAQVEQAQAHAQMYKQAAELEESKNQFWAHKMAGKVTYEPTPEAAIQIGEELRDEGMGELEKSNPEAWAAEVKKRALAQGQYQVMIPDKNGLPTLAKKEFQPGGGMPEGSSARSGTGGGGMTLDANHVNNTFFDALKQVAGMAKEKKDDGTPVHPEYQTEEGRIAAAHKIADAAAGRVSAAASAGKPKKLTNEQKTEVDFKANEQIKQVMALPGLSQQDKAQVANLVQQAKALVIKYHGYDNMPDGVRKNYDGIASVLKAVIGGGPKPQPAAAPAEATAAPAAKRSLAGDLREARGSVNSLLDSDNAIKRNVRGASGNVKDFFSYLTGE